MTMPGPGDPETWPAYTGHPNDPRNEDEHNEDCDDDQCEGACWNLPEPDYEAMYNDRYDGAYAPYDIYG